MKKSSILIIVTILVTVNIASAATTISTDITTGGTITSSGVATSSFVGALGIGTTSPGYKLSVDGDANITDMLAIGSAIDTDGGFFASNNVGLHLNNLIQNTDNDLQSGYGYGLSVDTIYDSDTSGGDSFGWGASIRPSIIGSTDVYGSYGIDVAAYLNDFTGDIVDLITANLYVFNAPGTITNAYGIDIGAGFFSTGYMTNRYGIRIGAPYGPYTSRLSNNYGLYIADQSGSGATSTYNLYSTGTNSKNYFGGKVGIGTTTPTTPLQVTTTSSNATSTITIGKTGQNKGSCLELFTSNGTAIYAYVKAGDTTFTLSSVSCK